MGRPHPPTTTQTDSYTAYKGIIKNIQPKTTKSMDMPFRWLGDREFQK